MNFGIGIELYKSYYMPDKVITALINALNEHREKWGDHNIITNTHLLEILKEAQNELDLDEYAKVQTQIVFSNKYTSTDEQGKIIDLND